MGFAALYPSYVLPILRFRRGQAVVVEDGVEHQRIAADRAATPDRVDRDQPHVAAAVACVDHRRAVGHLTAALEQAGHPPGFGVAARRDTLSPRSGRWAERRVGKGGVR